MSPVSMATWMPIDVSVFTTSLLVARTASATAKAPSSRPSMAARISVLPGLLDVVILKDSGSLKMLDEFLSISSQATILTMTT